MTMDELGTQKKVNWTIRILVVMLIFLLNSFLMAGFRLTLTPFAAIPPTESPTSTPEGSMVRKTPTPSETVTPSPTPTSPPDRQQMLRDLSNIMGGIPILSYALGATAEFLPILLAIYWLGKVANKNRKGFIPLLNFSIFLALVHFGIYFVPALSRVLLVSQMNEYADNLKTDLTWLFNADHISYDMRLGYGGWTLGIIVLGVLLPIIIWQWVPASKPVTVIEASTEKKKTRKNMKEKDPPQEPEFPSKMKSYFKKNWVDLIFHVLVITICLVVPSIVLFNAGFRLPEFSSLAAEDINAMPEIIGKAIHPEKLIALKGWFADAERIWVWIALLAGGLVSLGTRWLLGLGMYLLKRDIPVFWFWISTLIVLGVCVFELPVLWGYPGNLDAKMNQGILWFVLMVALGLGLSLGLARACHHGLRTVMGWKSDLSCDGKWLGTGIMLIFSIPTLGLVDKDLPLGRLSDIYQLAYRLDDLLIFVWIAAVLYILYIDGKGDGDLNIGNSEKVLALLAAGVFLFDLTAKFMYVPVTYFVGYLALWQLTKAEALNKPEDWTNRLRESIRAFSMLRLSEQMYGRFRRAKTKTLSDNESTLDVVIDDIEKYETKKKELENSIPDREDGSRINPLAFGPHSSAWQNGIHGVRWSLVLALPWILIYTFAFLGETDYNKYFPLLDFVEDLVMLAGLWLAIGFIMGYFFPYITGSSGLQKGLALGFMLIAARMPLSLAYNREFEQWQTTLIISMQILVHCMLLGMIFFDFYVLNKHHFSFQQLLEIHGLSGLGIWVSSLFAAVLAALTPILTAEAGTGWTMVLQFIKKIAELILGLETGGSIDIQP